MANVDFHNVPLYDFLSVLPQLHNEKIVVSADAIDFIFWKCEEYQLSATVRFHTVALLNKYLNSLLSKHTGKVRVPMLLRAVSCLQIVTKSHETGCLSVNDILQMINSSLTAGVNLLTKQDVVNAELEILDALNYDISVNYCFPHLELMLEFFRQCFACEFPKRTHSICFLLLVCLLHMDSRTNGSILFKCSHIDLSLSVIKTSLILVKVSSDLFEQLVERLNFMFEKQGSKIEISPQKIDYLSSLLFKSITSND
ncbi:hypothetical protein RCL1_007219 [Eukaryota sp. TZLM3-RCL]